MPFRKLVSLGTDIMTLVPGDVFFTVRLKSGSCIGAEPTAEMARALAPHQGGSIEERLVYSPGFRSKGVFHHLVRRLK